MNKFSHLLCNPTYWTCGKQLSRAVIQLFLSSALSSCVRSLEHFDSIQLKQNVAVSLEKNSTAIPLPKRYILLMSSCLVKYQLNLDAISNKVFRNAATSISVTMKATSKQTTKKWLLLSIISLIAEGNSKKAGALPFSIL